MLLKPKLSGKIAAMQIMYIISTTVALIWFIKAFEELRYIWGKNFHREDLFIYIFLIIFFSFLPEILFYVFKLFIKKLKLIFNKYQNFYLELQKKDKKEKEKLIKVKISEKIKNILNIKITNMHIIYFISSILVIAWIVYAGKELIYDLRNSYHISSLIDFIKYLFKIVFFSYFPGIVNIIYKLFLRKFKIQNNIKTKIIEILFIILGYMYLLIDVLIIYIGYTL